MHVKRERERETHSTCSRRRLSPLSPALSLSLSLTFGRCPHPFFLLNFEFLVLFYGGIFSKDDAFLGKISKLRRERERRRRRRRRECLLGLRSDTRRDANRPPLPLLPLLLLLAAETRTERNCCTSWSDTNTTTGKKATPLGRDTERAAIDVIVVAKGTIRTEEEGRRCFFYRRFGGVWERAWCEGRKRKRWFCLDRLCGSR